MIVPEDSLRVAQNVLRGFPLKTKINVLNEEDILNPAIRKLVKKNYPERYGWILQQFIKIAYSSQSKQEAVLVVDADTVIIRPIP